MRIAVFVVLLVLVMLAIVGDRHAVRADGQSSIRGRLGDDGDCQFAIGKQLTVYADSDQVCAVLKSAVGREVVLSW